MSERARAIEPLTLTTNPKLDTALNAGWEAWETAARQAGPTAVAGWLARRAGDAEARGDLFDPVHALLTAADDEERGVARAELAEVVGDSDDSVADMLWEGVLAAGRDADDAEVLFEATTHLAAIAEAHGDPLAAAEYHIDFLNWRRQAGHASDPEAVESAFDEIVRLAELDGEPKAAAIFAFRQAGFTRLLERDEEAATTGDWERDGVPYTGWA
jgi:hypothetical protein